MLLNSLFSLPMVVASLEVWISSLLICNISQRHSLLPVLQHPSTIVPNQCYKPLSPTSATNHCPQPVLQTPLNHCPQPVLQHPSTIVPNQCYKHPSTIVPNQCYNTHPLSPTSATTPIPCPQPVLQHPPPVPNQCYNTHPLSPTSATTSIPSTSATTSYLVPVRSLHHFLKVSNINIALLPELVHKDLQAATVCLRDRRIYPQ